MDRKKIFRGVVLFLASVLIGGEVYAVDSWYIAPGVLYIIPDEARHAKDDIGLQIGIGQPVTPRFTLEWNMMRDTLPQETSPLLFKQYGWSLEGVHFLKQRKQFSSYALLGAGVLRTEFDNNKRYRPMVSLGVGALRPFWGSDRMVLRGDLRYRIDERGMFQKARFGDWIVHLGLLLPVDFSKGHEKSAPAESTQTPAAPPPTEVKDTDGDGVADGSDACMETPAGKAVNDIGCEASTSDLDGDGVPDSKDLCQGTPVGTPVDAAGCLVAGTTDTGKGDSDGDGVPDSADLCVNTPASVPVDPTGCAPTGVTGDRDSDGDGVPDNDDACSSTVAGAAVDERGCPPLGAAKNKETDRDADGVSDSRDLCLDSKSGEKVDLAGCKVAAPIVLKGIFFSESSDLLLSDSLPALDALAETLQHNPDIVIEIGGHTDNVGNPVTNQELSLKRATSVARYLTAKGVLSANLIPRGYGEKQPIADNSTPEGRAVNRRVELRVLNR